MSKFIILLASLAISSVALATGTNELSDADKRLLIGTLYLSQCVYLNDDFRKASQVFDKKNIREVATGLKDAHQYVDDVAMTRITLKKDICVAEIITKEMDKIAQSLPQILQVAGGKLSMKKVANGYGGKPGYRGKLFQNDKAIDVQIDFGPEHDDLVMVRLFKR